MRPTKTQNQVRRKALELHAEYVGFMREYLEGWGNLVDQLRVLGNLGAAGVEMAEAELTLIKLQDDREEKTKIVTALH